MFLHFPLLCIWQVSQNVVQACRQFGLHTLVCFEMLTEVKKKQKTTAFLRLLKPV